MKYMVSTLNIVIDQVTFSNTEKYFNTARMETGKLKKSPGNYNCLKENNQEIVNP